jgi:hypothetical protein
MLGIRDKSLQNVGLEPEGITPRKGAKLVYHYIEVELTQVQYMNLVQGRIFEYSQKLGIRF